MPSGYFKGYYYIRFLFEFPVKGKILLVHNSAQDILFYDIQSDLSDQQKDHQEEHIDPTFNCSSLLLPKKIDHIFCC